MTYLSIAEVILAHVTADLNAELTPVVKTRLASGINKHNVLHTPVMSVSREHKTSQSHIAPAADWAWLSMPRNVST